MKNLILVKFHPSIQLGHLYEHIICNTIKDFFYKKGLYKYTDYYLHGTTWEQGGVIEIELGTYTSEAADLLNQLPEMDIAFSDQAIDTAANQIIAEEEEPLGTTGQDAVKDELQKLHNTPWQNIDNISFIDTKTIRRKSAPLYISEGNSLPARQLTVDAFLDADFAKQHRQLLPLFRLVTRLYLMTGQDRLAATNGYYCDEIFFLHNRKAPTMRAILKVAHNRDAAVDIDRDHRTLLTVRETIHANKAFDRLVESLQVTSYTNNFSITPNQHDTLDDTHIYIGTKGWQQIATLENIKLLLDHTSIEVKFGRQKISSSIQ